MCRVQPKRQSLAVMRLHRRGLPLVASLLGSRSARSVPEVSRVEHAYIGVWAFGHAMSGVGRLSGT